MATWDLQTVRHGFLSAGLPNDVIDELLASFVEAKKRFYLGDHRPNAIEGGRYSEAALRLLQYITSGTYTPLSDPKFKADTVLNSLPSVSQTIASDSVRLHIPRALRVIYDIRNKRNAAHLSDGIDPNVQDSSLVIAVLDWTLAEFVRLYHNVSASKAQEIINELVTREVPMIQVFDGRPRILADTSAANQVLILLYWHGDEPLARATLNSWLPDNHRKNAARTLKQLHERHLVNVTTTTAQITQLGLRYVEQNRLIQSL